MSTPQTTNYTDTSRLIDKIHWLQIAIDAAAKNLDHMVAGPPLRICLRVDSFAVVSRVTKRGRGVLPGSL
jgi:deoxyadenosine/deoxycytidine kinase